MKIIMICPSASECNTLECLHKKPHIIRGMCAVACRSSRVENPLPCQPVSKQSGMQSNAVPEEVLERAIDF